MRSSEFSLFSFYWFQRNSIALHALQRTKTCRRSNILKKRMSFHYLREKTYWRQRLAVVKTVKTSRYLNSTVEKARGGARHLVRRYCVFFLFLFNTGPNWTSKNAFPARLWAYRGNRNVEFQFAYSLKKIKRNNNCVCIGGTFIYASAPEVEENVGVNHHDPCGLCCLTLMWPWPVVDRENSLDVFWLPQFMMPKDNGQQED